MQKPGAVLGHGLQGDWGSSSAPVGRTGKLAPL